MDSNKKTVIMLSGLGLDPAIFQRLNIDVDTIYHLEWLEPNKKESIENYAARMAKKIPVKDGKIILIGHSFGGIMMQEISKITSVDQVILLSSVKAKQEKPASMNFWMRAFPVHRLASQKMIIGTFKSWGKAHGYNSPASQKVFKEAAAKHSSYYFKWATNQICKWESTNITTPITHIHGTKDKTFPHKKIKQPVTLIEGGDHIMVFNKADEVSVEINKILNLL